MLPSLEPPEVQVDPGLMERNESELKEATETALSEDEDEVEDDQ